MSRPLLNLDKPEPNRQKLTTEFLLALVILLISGTLLLPGCAREKDRKELDFQFALPESWEIVNVARLDTNGDEEHEWVILYTFDQPSNQAFTPVRCAVYHVSRREPKLPIIYPYHLQAPSWTYLGEGASRTSVRMEDVITRIDLDPTRVYSSTNEVIVQSVNADGFVSRVSIFQWRDNVQDRLQDPNEVLLVSDTSEGRGQWYQCLGLFEATIKVNVGRDKVTVWNRTNDRSQLALVNAYEPTGGARGYLDENNRLTAPVSSCVDFAFGIPEDMVRSPYPEKIIMAFQKKLTAEPDYGLGYLTEAAQQKRESEEKWQIFSSATRPFIQNVCVKKVGYNPEVETKAEIQAFSVEVRAQGADQAPPSITTEVETWAEYDLSGRPLKQIRIVWELVKQNNEWKINDIRDIHEAE